MPKLKLTKTAIERLRAPDPSGRQTLYWDSDMAGFGLLISGSKSTKSFVVQRDLAGGKTRRVTVKTFAEMTAQGQTVDDVRREAADIINDMRRGNDPKFRGKTGTLQAVLDEYLQKPGLSPRTRELYRTDIERHLKPWLGQLLANITRDMVEDRHRKIAEEIAAGGRYSGHAQANRTMVVLRALWTYAARRDEALPPNPVAARLHGHWHSVPRRDRLVKVSELPRFYEAITQLANPVGRDYLLTLLFTGMRRREAAGLTWDMIDLAERAIRLPASATKAKRAAALPMADYVYELFARRREIGKGKFVFEAAGKSGHLAEPKFFLAQIAEATGIRVSAHDLRRTYATVADSADIGPWALRALLNHAPGRDVTSGYIIPSLERLRDPAQRVADRIKALCQIGN